MLKNFSKKDSNDQNEFQDFSDFNEMKARRESKNGLGFLNSIKIGSKQESVNYLVKAKKEVKTEYEKRNDVISQSVAIAEDKFDFHDD